MPSLTSSSVLKGAQCPFLYAVPSSQPLRAGIASPPPRCQGQGDARGGQSSPSVTPCCVPAGLGDTLPISTTSPGKKDSISLLKKKRNLETNGFILKDTAGHAKGCFKSAELRDAYEVLAQYK